MNDQEFNELVSGTRLSRESREAARLVFVGNDPLSQTEAAAAMGISKQRMNQIVNTIRRVEQERQQLSSATQGDGTVLLAVLDASYAFAVKAAREQLGDEIRIQSPTDGGRMVGTVLSRTDFHLVQSLGRDSVAIHELAKLDRVPPLGRNVAIQYQNGKGAVVDREPDKHRGSQSR